LKSGQEQFLLNKFPAKSAESAKSVQFNQMTSDTVVGSLRNLPVAALIPF
jgi:hypothetical protein